MTGRLLGTLAAFVLMAGPATAQPADSLAARRPAVSSLSLSSGVGAKLDGEARFGTTLSASLDFTRSIASGPAVVQVGVGTAVEFWGIGFGEAHVGVGVHGSAGPVLWSSVAGPSLVLADPRPRQEGMRVLPGAYAAMRAALVVTPKVGFGAEVFAHANAALPVVGVRGVFAFGRLPGALVPNPPAVRWGRTPRGP